MICPNCGHEIPDGLLLCEKCGSEINIVPDFEIEVENSINETLSGIVDEIAPENKEVPPKKIKSKEEMLEDSFFEENKVSLKKVHRHKYLAYLLLGGVLIIAAAILVFLFGYRNLSSNYQFRQSGNALDIQDYENALIHIDKAIKLKKDEADYICRKADILIKMSLDDEAIALLLDSINQYVDDGDYDTALYKKLIDIHISNEEYAAVSNVLDTCENEVVRLEYEDYLSLAPKFDLPTGTYEDSVLLTLTADNTGQIYYTLDGQDPISKHGVLYSGPINLLAGEYDVKAVYINQYGISSPIASSYYMINVERPKEPVVDLESGNYDKPVFISVTADENCEIYYTDDGLEPNIDAKNTKKYNSPIKVDFGSYNYCFICVNEDGIMSDIVKRSYSVELKTKITPKMAEFQLMNYLDNLGLLNTSNGVYSYKYDSIIEISGLGYYYKLDEYLTDAAGNTISTGLLYAVDAYNNTPYRLVINEDGSWGLINIG